MKQFAFMLGLMVVLSTVSTAQDMDTPVWEKFGINGQKHTFDQVYLPENKPAYGGFNVLKNLTNKIRYFHQMEDDYPNVPGVSPATHLPANGHFQQNTPAISNLPAGGFTEESYGRMHNTPLLRLLPGVQDGLEIQASLIVFENGTGKRFPNRTWTYDELGTVDNVARYAYAFADLWNQDSNTAYTHIAPILELGNEPWGAITPQGNRLFFEGFKKGFTQYFGSADPDDWSIQLLAPAMQAHTPAGVWGVNQGGSDYIGSYLTGASFDTLAYANVHLYSHIEGTLRLEAKPEAANSGFQHVFEMRKWLDENNAADTKIMVTELGWDSHTVGEAPQGVYLTRSFLILAARDWVERIFWYEDVDNPNMGEGLYSTSGLLRPHPENPILRKQGAPKLAYKYALQLKNVLGDAKIIRILQENTEAYAYLLEQSDGSQWLCVWRPGYINNIPDPDIPTQVLINANYVPPAIGRRYRINGDIELNATLGSSSKGQPENGASFFKPHGHRFEIEASPTVYFYEILPQVEDTQGSADTSATAYYGLPNLTTVEDDLTVLGDSLLVYVVFGNTGTNLSAPSKIDFYLSDDLFFRPSDYKLVSYQIDPLTPDSFRSISISTRPDIAPGTYYLGYTIDPDNTVVESNEQDNRFFWMKRIRIESAFDRHTGL